MLYPQGHPSQEQISLLLLSWNLVPFSLGQLSKRDAFLRFRAQFLGSVLFKIINISVQNGVMRFSFRFDYIPRYLQTVYLIRDWNPKYVLKTHATKCQKKKSNLIRKWTEDLMRHFYKCIFYKYTGSHLKMLSMTSYQVNMQIKTTVRHFPVGPVVKNLPCNAEAISSIPDLRRSPMPWGNKVCVSQILSPCSGACKLHLPSPCATTIEAYAL